MNAQQNPQRFLNFVLYSYWRSSCSWRCRLALNLLKVPYEYRSVHLIKDGGQNNSEQFQKLNPAQKVPVLEMFDSLTNQKIQLSESSSIIEFLVENFQNENSEKKILPVDTILKAKTRMLYNHIACNIQPIQNLPVLNKVAEGGIDKADWAYYWITRGLTALEQMISETKGKYCVGDNVSLADVYLVPQLYNARRFKVDLDKFPNLLEIETNLKGLEEFVKASPENQPDAE